MTKPDLKPNPKLGEGTATPEEMAYRSALIYNLSAIYEPIKATISDGTPSLAKLDKISNYIENFIKQNQKEADLQPHKFFYSAVLDANKKLHKVNPQLPQIAPDYSKLNPIQGQQHNNCDTIGQYLKGRISQALMIYDIQTQAAAKKKKKTPEEDLDDTVDSAFQESRNRLDLMGLSGYVEANRAGHLSTYVAAGLLMGEIVYVEWVSAGDDHVCDECDDLESNSPYSANDYPATPHAGCRCEPGEITIGMVNEAGDFVILHLYY